MVCVYNNCGRIIVDRDGGGFTYILDLIWYICTITIIVYLCKKKKRYVHVDISLFSYKLNSSVFNVLETTMNIMLNFEDSIHNTKITTYVLY